MGPSILQVVTDTDRRGAQQFAHDLEAALTRRGRDVRTVALAQGDVGGLDLPVLGTGRLSWSTLRALRREATRSAIVVAHGSTTLPATAIATFATNVPFVYRQISDVRFWARGTLRRSRVRAALSQSVQVVALWSGSANVVHEYLGVPGDRITVIPNAVDVGRFRPAGEGERRASRRELRLRDAPTAVFLGALVPEKGVDLAIEAIGRLDEVQLLVVGDGPDRARLEALARDTAPERIVFAGAVEDPVAALSAADFMVLPSRGGDSMPAVLIEAGLMALPCVATPIDAIPEVVVDGATGYLVRSGEATELANRMDALASSSELRRELGDAARAHCRDRFGIDTVSAAWDELLGKLVRGRS
jgi:glycosyltransferase involved in cell wall biosynthesis